MFIFNISITQYHNLFFFYLFQNRDNATYECIVQDGQNEPVRAQAVLNVINGMCFFQYNFELHSLLSNLNHNTISNENKLVLLTGE